ncbi:helix-turn-helix domain-containing protein [Neobacillus novalis]|uniref:Helix-turn-helix domain-containing protein n=1 Tax=Neobacillus novalis TaxID=220687 RepID=A0AA95MIW6_9BACI|nr:helix-turn-helix domain-containing protein [Neobacillus novalis]WHY84481.1 helix-turn-helix domain-containing protein [Neobacillus novalis]
MAQLASIILYCLTQLNGERTIYSIFHLLNGKKSSQTIQDAHLFSLKNFFGVYEPLSRESFEEIIQWMQESEWICNGGEQRFLLTPAGKSFLGNHPLPEFLNGWDYHPFTTQFWERLSLFIQVTSNLVFQESRYIPIQKNKHVHQWLKSVLKEIKVPRKEMGAIVYSELVECFNDANEIDPSLLVFRLTGFQQIGLTASQTAKRLQLEYHDYHIGFLNTLHYLIRKISDNATRLTVLAMLIHDLKQENELTLSSRKTQKLLNQGFSPEMIATYRQLKLSTIEDHFVEFALNVDDFSIDTYVDSELQTKILEISNHSATKKLKLIREKVPAATYFQIRLVLAKYGDR